MMAVTHLKSLQALELAIRLGTLKAAADHLGITPAAMGQRIRALEDYLGADLLVRGRSGIQPTAELNYALSDLQAAFLALGRVTETLDFQRIREIQIVADPDWSELWLAPRLPAFRKAHPNMLFCINGVGDVPLRVGAPDIRIDCSEGPGELLFTDILLPFSGLENLWRIEGKSPDVQMEGMALLHLKEQLEPGGSFGWVEWFQAFGHRVSGLDRGVRYMNARLALEAVRQNVGYLICGLSLAQRDLDSGTIRNLFPMAQHLKAARPYRLKIRAEAEKRPHLQKFVSWLRLEASLMRQQIENVTQ